MKKILFGVLLTLTTSLCGQNNWLQTTAKTNDDVVFVESRMPSYYQLFNIDIDNLKATLTNAPNRQEVVAGSPNIILEFPDREGKMETFSMMEAPLMEASLAAQFPMIKTYIGIGIDDKTARLYLSIGTDGLHAMVLAANRSSLFIDPYTRGREKYIVYSKSDLTALRDFNCEFEGEESTGGILEEEALQRNITDGLMREYNLAVATTIEYSAYHLLNQGVSAGATTAVKKAAVLSAITTTINRVRGIYERELGVTFVLNANETSIIFIDSDNFTNNSASSLINESQVEIDNILGNTNYDIGHTFSTGGGGLASLGGICTTTNKARAITGSSNPIGDSYDVDFVAHEVGHHFGANHSYNGDGVGNCTTSVSSTAAEPGSGSTIMAYAGICGSLNVQNNSDAYFHVVNLEEINNRLTNGTGFTNTSFWLQCSTNTATGNNEPIADAGSDYTIPKGTAFVLYGAATDADGDAITYCWDQIDLQQPNIYPLVSTTTTGPLYRSFTPTDSPNRFMPAFETVFGGSLQTQWEVTPTVGRDLNFSLTARDNRADGGQNTSDEMLVTVSSAAGPFTVSSQSSEETWATGQTKTISWNVAGTTANGINTANVEITLVDETGSVLSVLAASTPNDGSHSISVPNITTDDARVRVAAIGNIFYALNGATIAINTTPGYCTTLCEASGSTQYPDGATFVGFNTISNASSGAPAYSNFTNVSTTVGRGQTYNLTVRVNTDGSFTETAKVWIDWNRNCDLTDAGEEYDLGTAFNVSDGATSGSPLPITVPANAELGETRMRVAAAYNDGTDPTVCETGFLGEVEDYSLNVVAVLPVEWLGFTAKAAGSRQIQLDWQTATETNNAGFEIERSTDGKVFDRIAWMAGNGTSAMAQSYRYIDEHVRPYQLYYYRLKQIDYDGTFDYSELRSSMIAANGSPIVVYPNPVVDRIYVQLAENTQQEMTFELFDALGKGVFVQSFDTKSTSFSIAHLPAGIYFYRVTDGSEVLKSDRLVVK